jgi:hypothetical protein
MAMKAHGICLLLSVVGSSPAHADARSASGPTFFVLGAYVQPTEMMDTWKVRGINTLVAVPDGTNIDQWSQMAASKGLYMIRQPSSSLRTDINNPYLLAWAQADEPSNTSSTLNYGAVSMDPAELEAQAAPWRAAAAAEGKFVPVWANHVGGHIYPKWAANNILMQDYMAGSESDWLASDSYPIQDGASMLVDAGDYTSTQQGVSAFRQIEWSGGKSTMTFIGSSAFAQGQNVPTPAELKAQAWSAIINGSEGIIYFPVAFKPSWKFDATPPALVTAMTELHAEIKAIEPILMNVTAGGRNPYTVFHAARPGTAPKNGQLPYPFEATEIQTGQGTYRIILNLSDKDQVLQKPEWGLNNVILHGYEVDKGFDRK